MIKANASTDVTTYFVLRDSTNHAPKTDVTVGDIDLYYVEQGAAISAKADATALDAADSAHADNKAFHVGQGLYRIDWPDAAFDGGVGKHVILIVVCSGVDTTFLEVELTPAVNTVAVGGTTQTGRDLGASVLLSSGTGTGQISLSSGAVTAGTVSDKTGYALTSAYDAAKMAATQTSVDTIDGIVDAILVDTAVIGAAGAGLTAVPWNAAWDAEVQSECADALAAYDPPTKAELDSAVSPLATAAAVTTLIGYVDTEVASILAAVDTEVAAIKAKTDLIPASPAAVGDAMTLASGAITAAVIATGAIDADALATDAVAEIADGVWDETLSGHLGAGSTGAALNAAGAAGDPWSTALPGAYGAGTAGKIVGDNLNATVSSRATQTSVDTVDGIVDAILVDTAEIGTAGAGLTALASAANLATVAGYLDTEVAAILAAVDTEVAAIKAKTDNLPASPAAVGSAMTLASGAITAAVVATGAIDADAIAADAVTEIQSGLATAAQVTALNNVSAAEVVAAIEAAVPAVNVKQINDVALAGTGVTGDEMRPA